MSHTPGPWEVSDTSIVTEDYCIAVIEDDGGYEVTGEKQIANAHLIAAAPDLLEALQAILVMWKSSEPRKLDDALTWRANDEKAEAMARAAIAKATSTATQERQKGE